MDQKIHSTNYTGAETAGKNWTDKVMSVKQSKDDPPRPKEDEVGDDEWVSVSSTAYCGQFWSPNPNNFTT